MFNTPQHTHTLKQHMLQSLFVFLNFQYVPESRKFGVFLLRLSTLSFSVPLILADFSPAAESGPPTPSAQCSGAGVCRPRHAGYRCRSHDRKSGRDGRKRIPQPPRERGRSSCIHSIQRRCCNTRRSAAGVMGRRTASDPSSRETAKDWSAAPTLLHFFYFLFVSVLKPPQTGKAL